MEHLGRRALLAILLALSLSMGCEEDDQDRIDRFVQDVTGEVTPARVEHALSTYVDLPVEPLSVRVFGSDKLYRKEDQSALEEAVGSRTQRMGGTTLRILRKRVEIEGERARVELQLFGGEAGGRADYRLKKHDERWLLTQAYFGR